MHTKQPEPRPRNLKEKNPPLVCFRSSLSRHDDHCLELKTNLELSIPRVRSITETFVFAPQSLQWASAPKTDLIGDLRSRIRLSVPVHADGGEYAVSEAINALNRALRARPRDELSLQEAAKHLGAVLNETLKVLRHQQKREITLTFSKMNGAINPSSGLSSITERITRVSKLAAQVREFISRSDDTAQIPVVRFLDEYMSQLYVQFLVSSRQLLERAPEPAQANRDELDLIRNQLTLLQTLEAQYRRRHGFELQHGEQDQRKREEALLRLNHLKKFFQSKMFIDVSRHYVIRKVTEPAAAVAAAAAGSWAAFFQQYTQGSNMASFGLKSVMLISVAALVYVLKDRLKERTRTYLTEKASRILADVQHELLAQGKKIGVLQEWFNFSKPETLPQGIREKRRKAASSPVELLVSEDVFCHRQIQDVTAVSTQEGLWALQENLRLNLDRHLKFLDDAYKKISTLDAEGRVHIIESHRVYVLTTIIRRRLLSHQGGKRWKPEECIDQIYRVILDKNGIVRVDEVAEHSRDPEKPTEAPSAVGSGTERHAEV